MLTIKELRRKPKHFHNFTGLRVCVRSSIRLQSMNH